MFDLLKRHSNNKDKDIEGKPIISKDSQGNDIYWGECVICGERAHYKVSDVVTNRKMEAGQVYYNTHPTCANKWKKSE